MYEFISDYCFIITNQTIRYALYSLFVDLIRSQAVLLLLIMSVLVLRQLSLQKWVLWNHHILPLHIALREYAASIFLFIIILNQVSRFFAYPLFEV